MKKIEDYRAIKARQVVSRAIHGNCTINDFDIFVEEFNEGVILIKIKPKIEEIYIMFENIDLMEIGQIFKAKFKFIHYSKNLIVLNFI